ncbi:TP901 family phage tail tape measure protein [Arcicella aurantiaca]|uniref:TP901 family phage tail tape measure protein n=1 Tax=Arcicella aurantiaca TaxID=591202 RepID=A0A316E8S7_9BACT|nr:phage tail tape measure protein [Arcicella aurantiaca]PWK27163.1 TP901 family phage tail tape measure protein [Arcicella aurantiaca]
MAFKEKKIQLEIDVTTQKAVREIARLQHEFSDLQPKIDKTRKEVDKASKALEKFKKTDRNENNEAWKKAYDNYYKADKAYRDLKKTSDNYTVSIERQVKELGVAGLTNKELNRYYTEQKRALDGAIRGTEEYEIALKNLRNAQEERFKRKDDIAGEKSLSQQLKGGLMPALIGGVAGGVVVAAQEALAGVFGTVENMIKKKAQFAKAMGNLSAITGLDPVKDAKDLEFYADAARAMGKAFSASSVEVVNTITIVGSLKPELLKQKEALVSVTKDIITLSKASGGMLSIEDSAKAVTGALNQFGESAFQSTRYINVMAAGAKAGSSEINETAAAFKESGAILNTSNISFEESNALVQALSSKMIKGSEAGTNLRNIFSRLLTGTDELNPAVVGLNTALDNLAKLSPAEIVKLFGQESVVAAMTLVDMRKEVAKLTKEVTNTSEATDQMDKQLNNLNGDLDKFSTSWSNMWHSMGSSSDGFWRKFLQSSTSALDWISDKMRNTTMVYSGGMIPIAFKYDSKGAEKDKIISANAQKREKWNTTAGKDVTDSNNYWLQNAKGKTIDDKKINASKETVRVSREQALAANKAYNDAFFKEKDKSYYSVAQKKDAERNLQELADLKNQALAKLKFAKEESQRLIKNADNNKKIVAKIKEGQLRKEQEDAQKDKGNKGKTDAEKLAEKKVQAEANANAKILKLRVEQIANENDKKEAQIRLEYRQEVDAEQKLVDAKELSQATFDSWIIERNRVLDKELADNDADANKKALEAAQKVNLEYTEKKLKGEINTQNKALKNAQKNEDLARAESIELFILKLDYELALLTANASQKLEIERKYLDDKALIAQKYDDLAVDKSEKQKAKDAKIKADLEQKQQKVYANIQKGIGITGNLVGEFFNMQRAGIENEQIQEDKRYQKKIQNLESQKSQGVISEQEYQDQKAAIELEHNKKSAEIKKKAWEADKQARIAQIVIETARAVVASLPNIPLSIISGVTGAAQLAVALSQEPPNFDAYAKGGFTDNKSPDKFSKLPTSTAKWAIVNEEGPEFITNNTGVNAPEFPYILPILRKMNTGQTVFPDLKNLAAQMQVPQFKRGDFTSAAPSFMASTNTAPQNQHVADAMDGLLLQAINRLNDNLETGIQSYVMFTHKHADDFNELLTINQDTRKRASANQNGNINK